MNKPGFKILYHPLVVKKDIPKLSKTEKNKIKQAIENKLINYPQIYGQPLRGTLKHYWKLRIGDWRIIYIIKSNTVIILLISHRGIVYKEAKKRL